MGGTLFWGHGPSYEKATESNRSGKDETRR
jgi:hypothetical protein